MKVPIPDDCQVLQLHDGRLMSFVEYGSKRPDARPVIFCHGIPDCRLDACMTEKDLAIAERLNVRWIGIDRPGIGFSTPKAGRKIIDWVEDLRQLIDHLDLPSYYILSVSGGTGYALAAAKCLPREQIKGVGVAIGVAPTEAGMKGMSLINKWGYLTYRVFPGFFRFIIGRYMVPAMQKEDLTEARAIVRKQLDFFKGADREEMTQPGMEDSVIKLWQEVYRQGVDGHIEDSSVQLNDWGFRMEDVRYPGIKLWYGEKDVNTPPNMGKFLAARLEGSVYKEYPGKSHFTMWQHIEEILQDLLSTESALTPRRAIDGCVL
jgi:pimeloyl-ACP methyl ester carboxylesterase